MLDRKPATFQRNTAAVILGLTSGCYTLFSLDVYCSRRSGLSPGQSPPELTSSGSCLPVMLTVHSLFQNTGICASFLLSASVTGICWGNTQQAASSHSKWPIPLLCITLSCIIIYTCELRKKIVTCTVVMGREIIENETVVAKWPHFWSFWVGFIFQPQLLLGANIWWTGRTQCDLYSEAEAESR